jgi:hypothetical protein
LIRWFEHHPPLTIWPDSAKMQAFIYGQRGIGLRRVAQRAFIQIAGTGCERFQAEEKGGTDADADADADA